jgi:arylsulfatase A-like enzyme
MSVVQKEQGDKGRFPWFKTPNLDRIANEGARFRNAFVVHSLCSPSRATFLTGLYSHKDGVKDNSSELRADLPNWAATLRDAGYATAYIGKWHMRMQRERPGFSTIFSYLGQGIYKNCPFLTEAGTTVPTQGWVDDVATSKAIEFIAGHKSEPFAMVLGFKTPHDPRTPPARRAHDFEGITIKPPVSYNDHPPFLEGSGTKPVDWKDRQPDWLNYFRCLAAMDDDIGYVLDALDANGVAENTVVVYVGDNGFYLGEHALNDKRNAHEESIRIPMVLRYPKGVKPGTLVDDVTLNIDFAPTVHELAGLPAAEYAQGRSWVPLLHGTPQKDWRDTFFYENYQDPAYPKETWNLFAVRTPDAKLIVYPEHPDWNELYNIGEDPYERKNLIKDAGSAELLKTMEQRLEAEKKKAGM